MNNAKAGPDEIPIELLKNNSNILAPIISQLCNLSLTTGVFPQIHKVGNIIPLYKNKEINKLQNYRPICLLNAMSKLIEKVVAVRLMDHLEDTHILSDKQYAYRKKRGTDSAILKFVNHIMSNFETKKYTVAAYIDLTKAFDCVKHDILLHKLSHYGVTGVSLAWFKDYLSNRKQRVVYQGEQSSEQTVRTGVPQGSILGPILFLIYFNDFCHVNENGNEILFADDATVYESGRNYYEVIRNMNDNLFNLSEWLVANKLSANIIKTEGMVFSLENLFFPLPPLLLYGNPLPYSHSFKLLGLIIDPKLTWKPHILALENKLSRACGILYCLRNKITRSVARIIYLSIAYPHLVYCNVIWSSCYPSQLERLKIKQKKIIRIIMKRNRFSHTQPLFKKLNLLRLKEFIEYSTSMFVFKVLNNLTHSPVLFNYRNVDAYLLRNNNNFLQVPFTRYRKSQLFIAIRGPNIWNNIPVEIRNMPSIAMFKRNLKRYYLVNYDQQ